MVGGVVSWPLVSIVVPTYNRRGSLSRLLNALTQQTYPAEKVEVVVVDDGSTDGTPAAVKQLRFGYSLEIIEQAHAGPAAARNLGAAHARGPLILFLDDDVVPVPELIAAHVASHPTDAGSRTVVIGPMSPPVDWPRPAWVRWEEKKLDIQYRAMLAGLYPCTARQFYTGNASLARALLLECGGFDPSYKRAEDVELGYRLRDRGARFIFNPYADVKHYAARSFRSWCHTPYQYGRYDVLMARDKGQPTLRQATEEFHGRHPLNRVLLRLFAGHRRTSSLVAGLLGGLARVMDRVGARQTAAHALSAVFNLLYWQGAAEELGDRGALWRAIDAGQPDRALARIQAEAPAELAAALNEDSTTNER